VREAIGTAVAAHLILAATAASAGSVCRVIGASAANAEVKVEIADAGVTLDARCDRARNCLVNVSVDGKQVYDRETTLHEVCYNKSKWFDKDWARKCRGTYDTVSLYLDKGTDRGDHIFYVYKRSGGIDPEKCLQPEIPQFDPPDLFQELYYTRRGKVQTIGWQ
jgi:hypothetical protein